jgi:hypothetical protein
MILEYFKAANGEERAYPVSGISTKAELPETCQR